MPEDQTPETPQSVTPPVEGTGQEPASDSTVPPADAPADVDEDGSEPWDEARAKEALRKKNNENKNLRDRAKAAEEAAAKWAEYERTQMDDKQRLEADIKTRDEKYTDLIRERNTLLIQKAYPVLDDDLMDLLPLDKDFEVLDEKAKALAARIEKAAAKSEPTPIVVPTGDLTNGDTDGDETESDPRKLANRYAPRN